MQETWVWFLGQEDPLEKEMAAHSNVLAWRMLWTEQSSELQSMGLQKVTQDWVTDTFTLSVLCLSFLSCEVSAVKSVNILMGVFLYVTLYFPIFTFKILSLTFAILIMF